MDINTLNNLWEAAEAEHNANKANHDDTKQHREEHHHHEGGSTLACFSFDRLKVNIFHGY